MRKRENVDIEKYRKIFRMVSFVILLLVSTTTVTSLIMQAITSESKITDKIYGINGFLCVISIIASVLYILSTNKIRNVSGPNKIKVILQELKTSLKKNWPCAILVVFMLWTAVGCIQASSEAAAERLIRSQGQRIEELQKEIEFGTKNEVEKAKKELESLQKKYDKNLEIANWSSGDRMANAADRSWNGCDNLKDGYFSFLFYAMVAVNVLMLGANSDKLKKVILRTILYSATIIMILSFINLFDIASFGGIVRWNRAIFNNSNHYGYYLCIVTMLSATMFIKDKNINIKIIDLLIFALASFMLIINNTFGAYLGVMFAIAVLFIFTIGKELITILIKKNNYKESIKEIIKVSIVAFIFGFFSLTITNADASIYMDGKYLCKNSFVATIYGQHNVLIKRTNDEGIVRKITFEKSGDNRIYTINDKTLKLVKTEKDYDETAKYYKLEKHLYKIIEDTTTTKLMTPEEFSKPIVQKNFNQLFKDIGIIFNFYDENEKNADKNANTISKMQSGEKSGEQSGEISKEQSGEKILTQSGEEVNEKSGLTEDVSNTGSGRGEVWIKSLDLIKQRPLFGWGLENMLNEFYYQFGINEGRTHNLILQLAGTTGIVGMLLYIVGVAAVFFKVLAKYKKWGTVEYICVPTFMAYMVSSLFGNSAFYTSPYFMIILGMMLATMVYGPEEEENEKIENKQEKKK
ncbi:MAG: O-antigen ligase family protein [Clostridia bacterium]|nr:O-antigen ligase family protein [Clostridia bacterium]